MKILSKFKQKGKWIQTSFHDGYIDGNALGIWYPATRTILLNKNLSEKTQEIIFIHEMLHAISDDYEIKLTEKQIRRLQGPLTRLIRKICSK